MSNSRSYRPLLVGTKRVTYENGRYVVRNATTDRVVASSTDRGIAEGYALRTSMVEDRGRS